MFKLVSEKISYLAVHRNPHAKVPWAMVSVYMLWAQHYSREKLPMTLNGPSVPPETCCLWCQMDPLLFERHAADGLEWAHWCCQKILPMDGWANCFSQEVLPMASYGPTIAAK